MADALQRQQLTKSSRDVVKAEQLARVSAFLTLEADLLDLHRYDDWYRLWTQPCRYWVPANAESIDPRRHVSLIYDDADRLRDRVFRLGQPTAYTHQPPARLCRVIGNISVNSEDPDSLPGSLRVASRYVLEAVRRGKRQIYTAQVEHLLTQADGDGPGFAISEKKVILTANDAPLPSLLFLP